MPAPVVTEASPRAPAARTDRGQPQPARPSAAKAPAPEPSKPFELQVRRVEGGNRVAPTRGGRRATLNEKRAQALAAAAAPSGPMTEPHHPDGVTERPAALLAFDDLDDVTRVLDGNPALKAPALPGNRKGTVQQIDDDFRRMLGSRPSLTDEVSFAEDADERTDTRIPVMPLDLPSEAAVAEPAAEAVSSASAAFPPAVISALAVSVEQTSRRVAPLLSFRVAIL
ncbi:MAG: hypothetical protein ABI193_16220, partial [Minicystis sp.]